MRRGRQSGSAAGDAQQVVEDEVLVDVPELLGVMLEGSYQFRVESRVSRTVVAVTGSPEPSAGVNTPSVRPWSMMRAIRSW